MDKKPNDKVDHIPPDKEIDPDELVHEQQTVPDADEEQDVDDLVHSLKQPTMNEHNEEQDIDDLMHEEIDNGETDTVSSE